MEKIDKLINLHLFHTNYTFPLGKLELDEWVAQ